MKHVNVVSAVIVNDDGKFFTCRRGPGRVLEGYYEFPGGKIEEGETKEEALIREIQEELSSEIEIVKYLGVVEHAYTDIDTPFSITLHAYLCQLKSGDLTLSEHTAKAFLTKEELKALPFAAADIPFLDLI